MTQLFLGAVPTWVRVDKFDARAAALADRHYSRQTVGAKQCLAPGCTLLMLTVDERAVWGVVEHLDPIGELRWRNSLFHTESTLLTSSLIKSATSATFDYWRLHYRRIPRAPLRTEIDIDATRARRSKRHEPGHCYLMAGWRKVRDIPASHGRSAKVELEAPERVVTPT